MSIFGKYIQSVSRETARPEERQSSRESTWIGVLFWISLALLLIGAFVMRLYLLDIPFMRDYDEGVYWQSLRAMLEGQSLYHAIFYSQPPFFLLSIFPVFALFGGTLWAARLGIALISLAGFVGMGLLGKALVGRAGALVAVLLLLLSPFYLAISQTVQAEIPALAFTQLSLGLAFCWWQQPDGKRGVCLAALTGITLALSIGGKLLSVSTLVPIALLMCARVWQIWRKQPGTGKSSWIPVLTCTGLALLTLGALFLPFLGSFADLWAGMVAFHEAAARVMGTSLLDNYYYIQAVIPVVLLHSALYGTITAFLRRDWRVVPLLVWLLAAFFLLLRQFPLFYHHMITLIPPLIALTTLGVAGPGAYRRLFSWRPLASWRLYRAAFVLPLLAGVLMVRVAMPAFTQEMQRYADEANHATSTASEAQQTLSVARILKQSITPEQWVITDAPFIAGLADRDVPPALVDTSSVRVYTGYLTLAQLEEATSDPRVHAVLFYTHRLRIPDIAGFHEWVAQHFRLAHTFGVDQYGTPQELWVR